MAAPFRVDRKSSPWRRSKRLLTGIDGVRCQQSHAHVAAIQDTATGPMKSGPRQCIYRMKNALSIAEFLAAKASTNPLLCPALISHKVRGRLDPSGMAGRFLLHQRLRHSILDPCFRNNDCERVSKKDELVAGQGLPHMPFTSVLPLAFLVHEGGRHETSDSRIPERAPR